MGASLLANAIYQATLLSSDTPLSRAGSLPHLNRVRLRISSRQPWLLHRAGAALRTGKRRWLRTR
ncbi:hypothetical protein FGA82_12735 [Pseudomonas fluorescens]|nr:hypothetical protein FGA82_12735 [Pseudomonas fluorescens]